MLKKYLSLCMISNINEERKKNTLYIGFLKDCQSEIINLQNFETPEHYQFLSLPSFVNMVAMPHKHRICPVMIN